MRVLALDTTTRAGSVAVMDGDRLLVEHVGDAARTHAERLPGEITDALTAARLSSSDIDLYAVASGPGSFTGLRIGIATIQGFAFVHGKLVAPISALRALAEIAAAEVEAGARVGAWMDAHRRDVFSALYAVEAPAGRDGHTATLVELEAPAVGPPASVLARWSANGQAPAIVAGDGAALYPDVLKEARIAAPRALASVIGRLAVQSARAGHTVSPESVQPLYVRRPDAEVAREAAHARR